VVEHLLEVEVVEHLLEVEVVEHLLEVEVVVEVLLMCMVGYKVHTYQRYSPLYF